MERITVNLKEWQIEYLDRMQDEQSIDSRSEALRRLFQRHDGLQRGCEIKIESLEEDRDNLQAAVEKKYENMDEFEFK